MSGPSSFSHPALTLHTRHAKDDELLLSTFVHEQFHWFLTERRESTGTGDRRSRGAIPDRAGGRDRRARDEYSIYLHVLVCYLEQQADLQLLGELKTRQVMEFWATDHYTWV